MRLIQGRLRYMYETRVIINNCKVCLVYCTYYGTKNVLVRMWLSICSWEVHLYHLIICVKKVKLVNVPTHQCKREYTGTRGQPKLEVSKGQIQFLHRSTVPTGSCLHIISLTFHLCTGIPLLCNTPNIWVWPIPGVTDIISCMIFLSSPSPAEGQFISSSSLI